MQLVEVAETHIFMSSDIPSGVVHRDMREEKKNREACMPPRDVRTHTTETCSSISSKED